MRRPQIWVRCPSKRVTKRGLAPDVFLFPFSLVFWLLFNVLDWFCRLMGWVTPNPRNGKHPNDKE